MAKDFKLGQGVVYTDANGYEKAARITGTRDSVKAGTEVTRPDAGHANLRVYSPAGKDGDYDRANIEYGTGPRTFRRL